MSESFLKIESVSKSFGNTKALDNVSLDINKSELFSLLGSSGCGKSTLLRIIAGFEKPDSGKIYLDGEDITSLPPYLRPLNIMFQNYALFPHLNVKKNIEFGLKEENLENNEIDHRVKEITALLELTGLENRKITEISGGQQQRVALARCLVKKPKLLLLDEPLAALDKKLRVQTQFELVNLQYKLGITFIIVTHDQEDLCLIRPEKIKIQKFENQNTQNQCLGVVKEVAYLGSYTKYLIESNGFNFYAFMQNEEVAENLKIKWDDKVICTWSEDSIFFFDD